jgi:hypothetical protein
MIFNKEAIHRTGRVLVKHTNEVNVEWSASAEGSVHGKIGEVDLTNDVLDQYLRRHKVTKVVHSVRKNRDLTRANCGPGRRIAGGDSFQRNRNGDNDLLGVGARADLDLIRRRGSPQRSHNSCETPKLRLARAYGVSNRSRCQCHLRRHRQQNQQRFDSRHFLSSILSLPPGRKGKFPVSLQPRI